MLRSSCYCFLLYRFWESFVVHLVVGIRDSRGEGANPLILWTSSRGGPHKKLLFDHMMDGFHVLLPKTLAIKLIEYRFFNIMLARLDYEYSPNSSFYSVRSKLVRERPHFSIVN